MQWVLSPAPSPGLVGVCVAVFLNKFSHPISVSLVSFLLLPLPALCSAKEVFRLYSLGPFV